MRMICLCVESVLKLLMTSAKLFSILHNNYGFTVVVYMPNNSKIYCNFPNKFVHLHEYGFEIRISNRRTVSVGL